MEVETLKKLGDVSLLVVEDDRDLREAIKNSMALWCKNVYTAEDGEEGLLLYSKKSPDVIVTDIHLPRLSGLGMARKVREISDSVPIIVMTAFDTVENIEGSVDVGGYVLLKKPIGINDLALTILMSSKKGTQRENIDIGRGFWLDGSKKTLVQGDQTIAVTKKEYEILHLLASKKNSTVTYQTMEQFIWRGEPMSGASLRVHINKLRAKTYKELIRSVSGVGYRMEIKEQSAGA